MTARRLAPLPIALVGLALATSCASSGGVAVPMGPAPGYVEPAGFIVSLSRTPLMSRGHGVLLVGYDVEAIGPDETVEFLRKAADLHRELDAPATLFPTGLTLETLADEFRTIASSGRFDVETHTYTHERLTPLFEETVAGSRFLPAAPQEVVEASIRRSVEVSARVFGRASIGLTAPFGAYRGLVDRPDLLAMLQAAGIRFVRSYSRNEHDWQPVTFDAQPFWYAMQGHPAILEIPIQGWQDVLWRETHGWGDLAGYRHTLDEALDTVASRNLVWSYCGHDWGSLRGDPELTLIRHLLEGARRRGVVMATHRDFYDAARAAAAPRSLPVG